ncbi:MAG: hypothetical protein SF069_09390 [Phycisphaerae bacterium]|nr:hypothetical protein [Phycisphaerae bacterium]
MAKWRSAGAGGSLASPLTMHDYFTILGLAPGVYSQREIDARFAARRESLLQVLRSAGGGGAGDLAAGDLGPIDAGAALDELHRAYQALSDPDRQAALREELLLRARGGGESGEVRYRALRRLIADSLEDGLLRYSRRQQILDVARELGLSDFETQLIIAQVQFGGIDVLLRPEAGADAPVVRAGDTGRKEAVKPVAGRRLAAAAVLGVAMAVMAIAMLR